MQAFEPRKLPLKYLSDEEIVSDDSKARNKTYFFNAFCLGQPSHSVMFGITAKDSAKYGDFCHY